MFPQHVGGIEEKRWESVNIQYMVVNCLNNVLWFSLAWHLKWLLAAENWLQGDHVLVLERKQAHDVKLCFQRSQWWREDWWKSHLYDWAIVENLIFEVDPGVWFLMVERLSECLLWLFYHRVKHYLLVPVRWLILPFCLGKLYLPSFCFKLLALQIRHWYLPWLDREFPEAPLLLSSVLV